jgi:hypothetical protein
LWIELLFFIHISRRSIVRHEQVKNSSDVLLLLLIAFDILVCESVQKLGKARETISLHALAFDRVVHQSLLVVKNHAT